MLRLQLRVLILDEADQLLEMGFQPSITKIISFLPPKGTRQNLLFSATVPDSLHKVAHLAMQDTRAFINTIPEGEERTHEVSPAPRHRLPGHRPDFMPRFMIYRACLSSC